jgi:predicted naringenin-chalcone synthase
MSLTILGIGTATPTRRIAQADAARLALAFTDAEPGHDRLLAALYRQTRIRSRGSVLLDDPGERPFAQTFFPPAAEAGGGGPTTAVRMERYAAEAGQLAVRAARRAVDAAAIDPRCVTHLVTCSCTGFANPGVDLDLVAQLGLRSAVSRTHIGFMGCHGAFNALRVADAFATAEPGSVPLVVCVELCSLHFQYGSRSDLVVANSIFADGAAALVGVGSTHAESMRAGRWVLDRQWSTLIDESRDEMGWIIGDHGFEMNLSATVPATIARALPGFVDGALADRGLARGQVGSWAVHPGGPRVLAHVQDTLGLPPDALAESAAVLADHGNMSSATILFILERMLRAADAAGPCMAMAFGPGLTAELALLARC